MMSSKSVVFPMELPIMGRRRGSRASNRAAGTQQKQQRIGDATLTKWIKANISKRECMKYTPVVKKDKDGNLIPERDPLCHCLYKRSVHSTLALQSHEDGSNDWSATNDTKLLATDAFGDIQFVQHGSNTAKYVRTDHHTEIDSLLTLLFDHWNLELPSLLISVTGGAKNFNMSPRLKEVFKTGLMKAAESTGAWIITGGMHAGVMKHVGEAVRDHKIATGNKSKVALIGIAPWGCVNNKQSLCYDDGGWPAEYRFDAADTHRKQAPLDPNHSHFILVDNGTQHKYAVEIPLRAKLESHISAMQRDPNDDESVIPTVCLVLEGGPGSLETVKSAIQSGTPAVIIEGSGRAADILAYAYDNSKEEEVEVMDKLGLTHKRVVPIIEDSVWEEVENMIVNEFGSSNVTSILNWVKECLQKRDHLTVFKLNDMDASSGIDMAILQALLKVNSGKSINQLRLALTWNRIDVAQSQILTDDSKWEIPRKPNSHLYRLLRKQTDRKYFSLEDVGILIRRLVGDFYEPLYLTDTRYRDLDVEEIMSEQSGDCSDVDSFDNDVDFFEEEECFNIQADFDNPGRELFLWCILMNMKEMAMVFLKEILEVTSATLLAEKLLTSLANKSDDAELVKELNANREFFDNLAVGIISECYVKDDTKAQILLVRELKSFGRSTIVKLAVEADNKLFISHTSCQTLFNNIWRGRMRAGNGFIKLGICIICPIFIFFLVDFRPDWTEALKPAEGEKNRYKPKVDPQKNKYLKSAKKRPGLKRQKTLMSIPVHDTTVQKSGLNPLEKIGHFYNAPVITFIVNCISYVAFLILFGVIIMTDFHPQVNYKEIILIVWVFTIFAEELRQIFSEDTSNFIAKFKDYISDLWNILDVITLTLFITGLVLRFIPDNAECFEAARIVLAINLMTFCFRTLNIYSIHKELGPKLVMIGYMMVDLFFFMMILLVFIAAYGIAAQAILYPNSPLGLQLIVDIFRKSYWQIYGELFLEELEGEIDCSTDPALWANRTARRCPEKNAVVPYLLAVYILIANVLMLNLLIAMFSYTFDKVQANTDTYWLFHRYFIIKDYYDRPPLAPPFIIFSHIFILLRKLCRCCGHCKGSSVYRMTFSDSEDKELVLWEKINALEYARKAREEENEQTDHKIQEISERTDVIAEKVEELMESSFLTNRQTKDPPKLPAVLEDRLGFLQAQMDRTNAALDWIIESLVEKNIASKNGPPKLQDIQKERELAVQRKIDEENRKKKEYQEKLQKQLELHVKSRTLRYPTRSTKTTVYRFEVPDENVDWNVMWQNYEPPFYTDRKILTGQHYTDPDLLKMPIENRHLSFNELDEQNNVDRRSFVSNYEVKDGIPLNPMGRTGLQGRGVLGRWGPNHAGDPIITRWKRDAQGQVLSEGGKQVLEFVSVLRSDNQEWALPGGFLETGMPVHACMKADFREEALGNITDEQMKLELKEALATIFKNGTEIYKGYSDDPRNTDNAWVETTAYNYHDDDGKILKYFILRAGERVDLVRWQKLSSRQQLYAIHLQLLQMVAARHNAYF